MSLAIVAAQLLAELAQRPTLAGVSITAGGPVTQADLQNDNGSYEAIWIASATSESIEPPVMGVPVWLDERYTIDLVIQVLKVREDADTTMEALTRAEVFLHDIIAWLCADPSMGIAQTADIPFIEVLPSGWDSSFGFIDEKRPDEHGAGYVLHLDVHARLTLT